VKNGEEKMKVKKIFVFSTVFVLLATCYASAHKVIVFAWVEKGMIYTESSFGSKREAKNCTITVVDENDMVIHKGQTDQDGKYSFVIPEKINSDLIIKLDAGAGHQAQWKISENELKSVPLPNDIQAAMIKKENLEKPPSVFKIITGIAVIFLLAMAVKFLKRKY